MNSNTKYFRLDAQSGLTLIEMMTALVIGSVLLAGLTQVFVASRQGYKLSESQGYLQESGRLAMFAITQDLRRAGYWGGNADTTSFSGGTTAPVPPTPVNFNTCPAGGTVWGTLLQQRVLGLDDTNNYDCIPDLGIGSYLKGDIVVARFADTQPLTDPTIDGAPNRLFLRTSLFSGRVFTGSARTNTLNVIPSGNGPVASYTLVASGYYVGDTGLTCQGAAIPALHQVSLDSAGAPTIQNIIAGVEDLQVQWGWDSDGDGVPNRYVDADSTSLTANSWNWPGFNRADTVISARVWVLARAECPDPTYKNDQTYVYGSYTDQNPYPVGDQFRRQLYSATVSLRN